MKTPILTMYKGTLPHWRMDASTYFVTWRLAASQVPLRGEEKTLVADAIIHFSGVRYDVVAYVIMDDHVHVLVTPVEGISLQGIVHNWKSFTANRLQRNFARLGKIWQGEYFDRIVRDEHELMEKINYILKKPRQEVAVTCGIQIGR
jgi:REP element-mobilizing transposase RayT